jgi:hypothetical protein
MLQSDAPANDTQDEINPAAPLLNWLALHSEVRTLTNEEVVQRLVSIGLPEGNESQYYYGLLNQQLDSLGAWIQARDAFDKLSEAEGLSPEQRDLAVIFRALNQDRINAKIAIDKLSNQGSELQQLLSETEEEKKLLEQKIQALTDLESVISTRKEE